MSSPPPTSALPADRARPQSPAGPLRVVDGARRARSRRRSWAPVLGLCLVVGSLLVVVIAHALLAGGQLRLSERQDQLAREQATHRQMELTTARLEAPSRVVAKAEGTSHLVAPDQITQLPSVSLETPVPTPRMYADPPGTTATTAPASSTTTSSSTTATTSVSPAAGSTAATKGSSPPGTR